MAVMEGAKWLHDSFRILFRALLSMNSIWQDLFALHQILDEMNKIKRDQLLRDVQHWLSPPNPSMNQNVIYNA